MLIYRKISEYEKVYAKSSKYIKCNYYEFGHVVKYIYFII